MAKPDPISERLDQLHDQWASFAENPLARLLVWRITPDEATMIDAWIARESDAEVAQTPDLFVQLSAPFTRAPEHGNALAEELSARYAEALAASEGDPPQRPWRPSLRASHDDGAALLHALTSFRSHHLEDDQAKLVLWLTPGDVSSRSEYLRWLHRLVHQTPSERRIIALDNVEEPQFSPLAKVEPERVVETTCALDMQGALVTLAAEADNGSPGGRFRILQTQLGAALTAGDLEAALTHGAVAATLANSQGWPHLAAVTHMMLAAGFAMHERPDDALKAYGEADRLGTERAAQEANDGSAAGAEARFGLRIRLQARLGQGAVLLGSRAFQPAAESYLQTAAIARALNDPRAELDCYRLASFSRAQLGDARLAWGLGIRGFQLGLAMDEETRKTSTLLYLADHLLRMTSTQPEFAAHRRPIEQQLTKLLGADWRTQLVVTQAA